MSSPPDIPRTHILNYVTTNTDSPTNVRRLAAAATAWTSWAYLALLLLALHTLLRDYANGWFFLFREGTYVSNLYDRTTAYNPTPVATLCAFTLLILLTRFLRRNAHPRLMTALTLLGALPLLSLLYALVTGDHLFATWEWTPAFSGPHLVESIRSYCAVENPAGILAVSSLFLLFWITRLTPRPIRRGRPWAALLAFAALLPTTLLTLALAALAAALALAHGLGLLPFHHPAPLALLWLLPAVLAAFLTLLLTDILRFLLWITRTPLSEKPTTHFLPARTPSSPPAAKS